MAENDKKIALETEISAAKSLFLGAIVEQNLFPYPELAAGETETVRMVIDSVDKFMSPKADLYRQFDVAGAQSDEYIQSLRELGLFGLIIPESHDGIGLSNRSYARVIEQTSRYDGSTSLTVGAHSSIGMKGILLFGTDEQKKRYLPKLATGEYIAAFCLTEAGSGSDAGSIKTHAEKNPDGSWTLSGEKIWITNGAFADIFTVFARSDSDAGKITAFIVERAWGGVESGPKEDKMGIRASATTTVRFDKVRVPADCVLGEEGKGFKVAMSILNNGRTGLGGGSVGAMKRCIAMAAKQALERKQFGSSISQFELVKEKLSRMTVSCFATESVVGMVGHYIDSGVADYSVEAAMSKVYASEALWQVSNDALQIAGGNGFMRDFPYERIVRDCRINLIFEGTNEILRLYIALSALKDAGEYLKGIGKGVANIFNDPIKGFGVLSGYATKRFTELTSLGRDRISSVHPSLSEQSAVFEHATLQLSKSVNAFLRKHRGNVIGKQYSQKRLADSAIDIFTGLCVLSRVTALIQKRSVGECSQEIRIAKLFAEGAKVRIAENLRLLERPEDEHTSALADFIVTNGDYPWDVL
ncbi:MAG: acyl-CoA dehydrogenase family protein [Bdellovibrionota bacterium]